MKVLISLVGKRDPWGTLDCAPPPVVQYGAALAIALHIRPDLVFLLPTLDRLQVGQNNTMAEAAATVSALRDLLPDARVFLRPYDIVDPTDYAQVMPETERILRRILGEIGQGGDIELAVNISSGTPQMQAALQLAISAGLISAVAYQALDPRYLRAGQSQVREVAARNWSEALARDRARRLFEQQQFEACAADLEFLLQTPQSHRRTVARHLRDLCRLYSAVDHINYFEAMEIASALLQETGGIEDYQLARPVLESQAALLARLPRVHPRSNAVPTAHYETPEFLADIYHNAARCFGHHAYADCLARVWRVLEGMLYLRLRDQHRIEPTDLRASANQSLAQKIITFMGRGADSGKIDITLGTALRLFAQCIPDPDFRAVYMSRFAGGPKTLGQISDRLRDARNNSVVGHNALPVDEDNAARGLKLARQMLEALMPGIGLNDHPFAPAAIDTVGKVFFDVLSG